MSNNYKALNFSGLKANTAIYQAMHLNPRSATREDPAMLVMTDLKRIPAFTIALTQNIDAANEKMISCGVRLLFVVNDHDSFVGLITASDILGEKPVKYMQEHGGLHRDILVMDIMTRRNDLEAVDIRQVARGRVGDVVETLCETGRQHVLVYEDDSDNQRLIRGLFSSTQVSRQLGEDISLSRAGTFAALEMALVSAI